MQHNCAISIKYHENYRTFKLYLSSYGAPENVRNMLILAVRGLRGLVKSDPEPLLAQLVYQAVRKCKKATVTFHPREASYLWRYRIDLLRMIPTIKMSNLSNGISDTHLLFEFLGPAVARKVTDPQQQKVESYGKRRRGRPSNLSRVIKPVPAPTGFDKKTGAPIFEDDGIYNPDGTLKDTGNDYGHDA